MESGMMRMVNNICDAGYQPARERTTVAYISQFVGYSPYYVVTKWLQSFHVKLAVSLIVVLGAKLTCIAQCGCT
jgi:hypothetical protein